MDGMDGVGVILVALLSVSLHYLSFWLSNFCYNERSSYENVNGTPGLICCCYPFVGVKQLCYIILLLPIVGDDVPCGNSETNSRHIFYFYFPTHIDSISV